uniref:Uncharacterized protein n=1 Tax=Lepeophtheirus salmonis TaxID=72036 RepID=A0A0K2SWI6_LEPSM
MMEDFVPVFSLVSTIILSTLCLLCLVHSSSRAFKKNDPVWSYKVQFVYFILLIVSEARRIIVFLNYLGWTDITLPKVNCYFLEMRISFVIAMGLDEVFRATWAPNTKKWHIVTFILFTLCYPLPFMTVEYYEILSLEIYETIYCSIHLCIMVTIILYLINKNQPPVEALHHSNVSRAVVVYLLLFITQMAIRIVFRWNLSETGANEASTIMDCMLKIFIPIIYLIIVGKTPIHYNDNVFKTLGQKEEI